MFSKQLARLQQVPPSNRGLSTFFCRPKPPPLDYLCWQNQRWILLSCLEKNARLRWFQNCCCSSLGLFLVAETFLFGFNAFFCQLMSPASAATWLPELFLRSRPQAGRWSHAVRPTDLLESAAATMAVVEHLVTRGNRQGTLGYEKRLAPFNTTEEWTSIV